MKERNIPEEVVSFISKNIRLYQALIFFFRNQIKYFTLKEVAKECNTLTAQSYIL